MDRLRRLFEVFKANVMALSRYRPRVRLSCRVLICNCEGGAGEAGMVQDPIRGWRGLVAEAPEVHRIPGHHYSMMAAPHVELIAKHVNAGLERA